MADADSKLNVLKKKKKDALVAENFDNTAPVKKIVDQLQNRNRKNRIYEYYCETMRQRSIPSGLNLYGTHYLIPGQPLYSFSEEWDGGIKSGYFETFSHRSLKPKIISKIHNIEKNDPITDILKKKIDYNIRWQYFKKACTVTSEKCHYEWLDDDVMRCPKMFVDMAARWENRPDPFIDSTYNWYYAGHGNMHLISVYGTDYMLHSELGYMYLSPFTKDTLKIDYENTVSFDCGEGAYILETVFCLNILALRLRTKIIILKLVEPCDRIQIVKLTEMKSELPFTRISFDEYHKNILYVTTIDYRLTIVNIDRMTGKSKKLRGRIKHIVDNWNCVIGSEREHYVHVTQSSLTLYDKRTNEPFQRWKSLRKLTDNVACDNISVARYCKDKPLMYIGSNHHLFLIDMRYNNNDKLKAVQRWTHGMECPPTYMSICDFDYNKELICLSSQWCEDLCVVSNYSDTLTRNSDIHSVTMPYRPPSILKTFRESQLNLLCCDLYDPIDYRLTTAISGLSVMQQGENYSILMQNSLGDITSHSLFPKHMTDFIVDDALQQLHEWSKFYKREKKALVVSSVLDFSDVWRKLKRVPDTYKLGQNKFVIPKYKFKEKEIYEAFEKELDSGLLDVWMKDNNEEVTLDSTINNGSQFLVSDDE